MEAGREGGTKGDGKGGSEQGKKGGAVRKAEKSVGGVEGTGGWGRRGGSRHGQTA